MLIAEKERKGFAKVFQKAGESKTGTISLDNRAFRWYNVKTDCWEGETADYEIGVAANVSDVKLTAVIHVAGDEASNPYGTFPGHEGGNITAVPDGEFAALLGRPIPDGHWSGEINKTR